METQIQILEYAPYMAASLAKMWNASKDDWGGGNETKTPGQVAQRIEGSSIMHHYVAMAGDEAVGYASLGRYFGDADALYIELLGVRPDYQGKKIGKELVLKCVQRTIELGYPRLDIHTWSGNTAAVPLYKKCGYLWEDRADSTHLVNFIPEILGTELFKPFFAKADWYADSTRSWDIKPDGVKENNFELFGYSWEKDGERLAIGYERTGRRTRLIETDDYKIQMMAEHHELAFGLDYTCTFIVENKSGKDLRVKINGRDDKNIRFGFAEEIHLPAAGVRELTGNFSVGEITELQDKWKVHPCVLADVEINGGSVTFGLGICTKFPLEVSISSRCKVQQAGKSADCFINIRSSLAQDARVSFAFPQNALGEVTPLNGNPPDGAPAFTASVPARGKTAIPVTVAYKSVGYDTAPARYDITPADGPAFSFTQPLHLAAQDFTHTFHGETSRHYYIASGPWRVNLEKSDGEAHISHITNPHFSKGWFEPPKLGKPYDDEFNLIKPAVKYLMRGADIVMEAEYLSQKFPGMALTEIFTLSAAGIVTRHYRAQNRGTAARHMFLNDPHWFALGEHTTFVHDGKLMQNHDGRTPDGIQYGIDSLDPGSFGENWLFEAAPAGGRGFCWSPDVKPGFQWGNMAIFENDLGHLAPGDVCETPPVVYVYGAFSDFGDFSGYATGLWERENHIPLRPVELRLNGHNPFLRGGSAALEILNHRETSLAGKVSVFSEYFEPQTSEKEDDDDDDVTSYDFTLPLDRAPADGVLPLRVDADLSTYEKSYSRVLFTPRGEVTSTQNGTVLTVDNGCISFRADPQYGPVCFSLTTPDGSEWLTHQHPEHKPFAWFNPFLGGIRLMPPKMNNIALLKEKITADFCEVIDNFANSWQGVRTTLTFSEDDELRGAVYETYFVTQPGLPLLCTFYRFINGTGVYRGDTLMLDAFISPVGEDEEFLAEMTDKSGQSFRLRYGADGDQGEYFENCAVITGTRPQRLYLFHGNKNNGKTNEIEGDGKFPLCLSVYMECHAPPDGVFTSSPMFMLLTEQKLTQDALDDLERVKFS